jgi:putative phosphoribosyl transferase
VVARRTAGSSPGAALESVRAPVLLIVGEYDGVVIDLNRRALAKLTAPAHLVIVPGATHLFEEAGALERVVDLALDWFERYVAEP